MRNKRKEPQMANIKDIKIFQNRNDFGTIYNITVNIDLENGMEF